MVVFGFRLYRGYYVFRVVELKQGVGETRKFVRFFVGK